MIVLFLFFRRDNNVRSTRSADFADPAAYSWSSSRFILPTTFFTSAAINVRHYLGRFLCRRFCIAGDIARAEGFQGCSPHGGCAPPPESHPRSRDFPASGE